MPIGKSVLGVWLLVVGPLGTLSPVSLCAQAAGSQSPPSDLAVRANLEARFERIDEFQLSEGPDGADGNFFISGDLTPRAPQNVAVLRTESDTAVSAIADLLQIDLNEFAPRILRETTDDHGVAHRRYEFFFRGWRVERFELVTHIREAGTLVATNGYVVRFPPDQLAQLRDTVGKPVVTATEAEAAVLRALTGVPEGKLTAERVIAPDPPYLFWSVVVSTRNPVGSWRYYVDAQTGRVRNSISLLQGAH